MKTKEKEVIDEQQSFFFPRMVAYIIDIVLIGFVSSLIFIAIPENKNHEKYSEEYKQIKEKYDKKEISDKEYVNRSKDVIYDMDYTNTIASLTQIIILVGYFAIFQYYNGGQTIGKKIMKIKVVGDEDNELTLNRLTFRSLIVNSIAFNILLVMAVLFVGRENYYYVNLAIQALSTLIVVVIMIMILFRKDKRGLHDVITGTKVISTK